MSVSIVFDVAAVLAQLKDQSTLPAVLSSVLAEAGKAGVVKGVSVTGSASKEGKSVVAGLARKSTTLSPEAKERRKAHHDKMQQQAHEAALRRRARRAAAHEKRMAEQVAAAKSRAEKRAALAAVASKPKVGSVRSRISSFTYDKSVFLQGLRKLILKERKASPVVGGVFVPSKVLQLYEALEIVVNRIPAVPVRPPVDGLGLYRIRDDKVNFNALIRPLVGVQAGYAKDAFANSADEFPNPFGAWLELVRKYNAVVDFLNSRWGLRSPQIALQFTKAGHQIPRRKFASGSALSPAPAGGLPRIHSADVGLSLIRGGGLVRGDAKSGFAPSGGLERSRAGRDSSKKGPRAAGQ